MLHKILLLEKKTVEAMKDALMKAEYILSAHTGLYKNRWRAYLPCMIIVSINNVKS